MHYLLTFSASHCFNFYLLNYGVFMFKNISFSAISLFLSFTSAFSSDFYLAQSFSVQVGAEPAAIFYDSTAETYHIFCIGVDKNFNAIYEPDSGDIMPSWWTLKISPGNSTNYEAKKFENSILARFCPHSDPHLFPGKGLFLFHN